MDDDRTLEDHKLMEVYDEDQKVVILRADSAFHVSRSDPLAIRSRGFRALRILWQALFMSENSIKCLRLRNEDDAVSMPMEAFDLLPHEIIGAQKVFCNLCKLSLELQTYGGKAESHDYYTRRKVAKVLSAAVQLEELCLILSPPGRPLSFESFPTWYQVVLGGCTFPKLKVLHVENIAGTQEDWVSFFQVHASTLKLLSGSQVGIVGDGTWKHIFEHSLRYVPLTWEDVDELCERDEEDKGEDLSYTLNDVAGSAWIKEVRMRGESCPIVQKGVQINMSAYSTGMLTRHSWRLPRQL